MKDNIYWFHCSRCLIYVGFNVKDKTNLLDVLNHYNCPRCGIECVERFVYEGKKPRSFALNCKCSTIIDIETKKGM